MFSNFFMFGWLKGIEKYFSNQLIFLNSKENDLPSKSKENIFQFLMFDWLIYFEKYFLNQLIFLKSKENDFPSKSKKNIFQNSLSTSLLS